MKQRARQILIWVMALSLTVPGNLIIDSGNAMAAGETAGLIEVYDKDIQKELKKYKENFSLTSSDQIVSANLGQSQNDTDLYRIHQEQLEEIRTQIIAFEKNGCKYNELEKSINKKIKDMKSEANALIAPTVESTDQSCNPIQQNNTSLIQANLTITNLIKRLNEIVKNTNVCQSLSNKVASKSTITHSTYLGYRTEYQNNAKYLEPISKLSRNFKEDLSKAQNEIGTQKSKNDQLAKQLNCDLNVDPKTTPESGCEANYKKDAIGNCVPDKIGSNAESPDTSGSKKECTDDQKPETHNCTPKPAPAVTEQPAPQTPTPDSSNDDSSDSSGSIFSGGWVTPAIVGALGLGGGYLLGKQQQKKEDKKKYGSNTSTNTNTNTAISTGGMGEPNSLGFTASPTGVQYVNQAFKEALQVTLYDSSGKVAVNDNNTQVMIKCHSPEGCALTGTLAVKVVKGVASFTSVGVTKDYPSVVLRAEATGFTSKTSNAFRVDP